ncbi:MAG: hypothetical protein ABR548_14460 [Actinomycetota bacterium]|nr:hypothetical protein [Actinomycetota bacterium]
MAVTFLIDTEEDALPLPSIDIIAAQVAAERERQARHFEALDSKAGIIIGFAGILVALPAAAGAVTAAGRMVAILAAGWSGWAYLPRKLPVSDTLRLRDYVTADADFTKLHVLDTDVRMTVLTGALLRNKARRVIIAMGHLAAAVALIGGGILR